MTHQQGPEVTLRQILSSTWFNLGWKGLAAMSPLLFGAGVWVLNDIRADASSARAAAALVQTQVVEVNNTQQERADIADDRAKAADDFQAYVKGEIGDVKAGQQRTTETLGALQVSTARLLGMVEQISRQQDVAQNRIRPGSLLP